MTAAGPAHAPRDMTWSRGLEEFPKAAPIGSVVLLASLAINVLSLALPLVILQIYDRILPNAALETLLVLIIGLCVVLLLDAALRLARSYVLGWQAARFEHMSGCAAVDRLLSSNLASFEKVAPGEHLDRLGAIDTLRDFHAGQAKLLIADLPFIGLFLGLMWLIAGPVALVPLGLLLFLFAVVVLVGQRLKDALLERSKLDDQRYNFIIEVLGSVLTIKALAMETLMQRRYERLHQNASVGTYRMTFLSNLGQSVGAIFSNLTMVSVASVGAVYVMAGDISIGALAACTLLSGRAVQPVLRALGLWTQLQSIELARGRIVRLFDMQPEDGVDGSEMDDISGAIELRSVSFAYEREGPPLLERTDLKIAPGAIIGISGGTGSGKSTLLMLVAKLVTPRTGQVLIDGNDLAEVDPFSLREKIAYLTPAATLFRGTILENLTLFRGREQLEDALQAANLLGLDQMVRRLPAGYATRVGDGANDSLPYGTKQIISLARAFANKPKIILFDEANSSLDSQSDAMLKHALQSLKGGPTMILISHRPSILALADRVYDLQDGQLLLREAKTNKPAATPNTAAKALERVVVQTPSRAPQARVVAQ